MSLNKEAELLKDLSLFSKVDLAKLKLLAFTSERLTYDDNEIVFNEGDDGDAAYIILDGTAVVSIAQGSKSLELDRIKRGGFVESFLSSVRQKMYSNPFLVLGNVTLIYLRANIGYDNFTGVKIFALFEIWYRCEFIRIRNR